MHIVRVELEDIKSHRKSAFDLARGTTAITGANGAGKTTIIEAVAWALFDLLDYKKDDFVRRGAKKGTARVSFESSLDERRYVVYRDTGTGYNVYDPELKVKVADKKDEAQSFLRQHLGVEAGTDLELLFRSAIGVPQGTFTAIFLETPARRKEVFDRLLKVEEYKQSSDKLLETARYLDGQIATAREKIARAEGELSRVEEVEKSRKDLTGQTEKLEKERAVAQTEFEEKQKGVAALDTEEKRLAEASVAIEKMRSEAATAEVFLRQRETEREQAAQAAEKLKAAKEGFRAYLQAQDELKLLEANRATRDAIRAEQSAVETKLAAAEIEKKTLAEFLEKAEKAGAEIARLEPEIKRQEEMEAEAKKADTAVQEAKAAGELIKSLDQKIVDLREDYRRNSEKLKEAESKSALAAQAAALQTQHTELSTEIAAKKAKLEHDKLFRESVKGVMCPIVSEKCLNLKAGQTLEDFLRDDFAEVNSLIAGLEKEQAGITRSLNDAREGEKFLAALEAHRQREAEIAEQGKKLAAEKERHQAKSDALAGAQKQVDALERQLAAQGNPRERTAILRADAESLPTLKEKLAEAEKTLEVLAKEQSSFAEKLAVFAALDADWQKLVARRDLTAAAHRDYIANETIAAALPAKEAEAKQAAENLTAAKEKLESGEKEFAEKSKGYDAERHLSLRAELRTLETSLAEISANLTFTKKRAEELEAEIKRLNEVRAGMQAEFQAKDKLDKTAEAVKFIRDTLKEAAPRVARNYVYHVSLEANQLFREITGNPERSLKWTEDYAVMLEESGHERPFQNLSGGEQMAAALSVRLALLKQLSDVRLAFFDEPTTNMDAERRENLAQQISQIRHFDQLFVISHDDTFEGYVDNVIHVAGDGAE
jgi:exonuclease SbcC